MRTYLFEQIRKIVKKTEMIMSLQWYFINNFFIQDEVDDFVEKLL